MSSVGAFAYSFTEDCRPPLAICYCLLRNLQQFRQVTSASAGMTSLEDWTLMS